MSRKKAVVQPRGTHVVRMREDNPRFKLKKGNVLEAMRYLLDPSKFSILRRLSDDYDPCCNVYTSQV